MIEVNVRINKMQKIQFKHLIHCLFSLINKYEIQNIHIHISHTIIEFKHLRNSKRKK